MLINVVNYPPLKEWACGSTSNPSDWQTTIGWLTSALQRIFFAAFKSAFSSCPQDRHLNSDWLTLLQFSMHPHTEHLRLVFLGSTISTGTPANLALYSTKALS
jgi:hypothetical protein